MTELTLESLATRQPGASFLRTAAELATFIWLAAVVFEAWAMWSQYANFPTSSGLGSGDASRTDLAVRTLAATLNSTWGYALVAVGASGAAMMVEARRTRLLIEALDD